MLVLAMFVMSTMVLAARRTIRICARMEPTDAAPLHFSSTAGARGDQIGDEDGATAGVDRAPRHSHASQRGAGGRSAHLDIPRVCDRGLALLPSRGSLPPRGNLCSSHSCSRRSRDHDQSGGTQRWPLREMPEARPLPQKSAGSLQPRGQCDSPLRRQCSSSLGQPVPVSSAPSASGGMGAHWTRFGCAKILATGIVLEHVQDAGPQRGRGQPVRARGGALRRVCCARTAPC